MKIGKSSIKKQPGRRVDELHRSPTRFELLRAWIERIPKVRLYIGLTALTWLSLTALIGIGPRPLIERIISQGIIDASDRSRLESLELLQQSDPWMALVGVGIVVAAEMWIAWYFLERFGERILKTNAAIRLVLAASLTVLFTALARFFIELDFDPYLRPLANRNHAPRTEANVPDGGDHQRQRRYPQRQQLPPDRGPAARIWLRDLHHRARGLAPAAAESRTGHRCGYGRRDFRRGFDRWRRPARRPVAWRPRSRERPPLADAGHGADAFPGRRLQHPHADEAPRAFRPPTPPARQAPAQRTRNFLPLHAGRPAR